MEKRRPGRPKKVEKINLLSKSISDDILMQLYIPNIIIFKRIFSLIKQYKIDELCFEVLKDSFSIKTRSYQNDVDIELITSNTHLSEKFGIKSNLFYQSILEEYKFCCSAESINKIISTLSKNISSLYFILKKNDYKSILYINLLFDDTKIEKTFKILMTNSENNYDNFGNSDSTILENLQINKEIFNTSLSNISIFKENYSYIFSSTGNNELSCEIKISNHNNNLTSNKKEFITEIDTYSIKPLFNMSINKEINLILTKEKNIVKIDTELFQITFYFVK